MELQINSLETRIEKMQELFNKDLEEIIIKKTKSNYEMLARVLRNWITYKLLV